MKFTIKHEIRGRIRIHNCQRTMSADQADELWEAYEKGTEEKDGDR